MKRNFFDYLFVCHKMPSRSFFYKGKQFPICARCTGIFVGYIIGIITWIFYFPNIVITGLFFIPAGLDGGIQYFTKYESTNMRRLISGILFGIGFIFVLANVAYLARLNAEWVVKQIKK